MTAPERHVHPVGLPDGGTGALLLMPAWVDRELIGVKTVTYFPSNAGTAFVDTAPGAIQSGDLAQPLAGGVITEASIAADLRVLASGQHPGRTLADEITLFKSAGSAAADVAAARLALR